MWLEMSFWWLVDYLTAKIKFWAYRLKAFNEMHDVLVEDYQTLFMFTSLFAPKQSCTRMIKSGNMAFNKWLCYSFMFFLS